MSEPLKPSVKAQSMIESGELTQAEWEEYAALGMEMHRYRGRLSVRAPTWVMRAPVRSLDDFLEDLADPEKRDSARRDFANLSSASTKPFFKNSAILDINADAERASPVIGGGQDISAGEPIMLEEWFKPLPHVVYAFACDLSVTTDSTGLALVHYDPNSERVVLDMTARITARRGERVDYEVIRDLVRDLRDRGFRIGKVGFDQFQSNDSFNILEREGFLCEVVKYADSLMGCNTLQEYVCNKKLHYGSCDEVFVGEAKELQAINEKRVDHLKSGGEFNSKDVWDAVVNATFLCMGMVAEAHGDFLQASDIKRYDPTDVFSVPSLTEEQRAFSESELKARQLPHNGHALLAYVHCRYNTETDSDTVAIAVAAVNMKTNECRVVDVALHRKTPELLAELLADIEKQWVGRGFFRTRKSQSVEFFVPELHFIEKVDAALTDRAPHLALTTLDVTLSADVRVRAAQAAARDGRLTFPEGVEEGSARMRQLLGQLVAYPFVPNNHMLMALEGVNRAAEEADFVIPTMTSRVIQYRGGGG